MNMYDEEYKVWVQSLKEGDLVVLSGHGIISGYRRHKVTNTSGKVRRLIEVDNYTFDGNTGSYKKTGKWDTGPVLLPPTEENIMKAKATSRDDKLYDVQNYKSLSEDDKWALFNFLSESGILERLKKKD